MNYNLALSDTNEKIKYKDYETNSRINTILNSNSFHDKNIKFELKNCETIKGDDFCKREEIEIIDFLKIDVEGAERKVLKGFENKIREGKIKIIQFEYGYANGDDHCLMKDFYEFFINYGYQIGPLKSNGVLFMDFDYKLNNFNSGPNFVAVHKKYSDIINTITGKKIPSFPS